MAWADAEEDVADFYDPYVREWHPAKDSVGSNLYPFIIEHMEDKGTGDVKTINLLPILEKMFEDPAQEPDLTPLRK